MSDDSSKDQEVVPTGTFKRWGERVFASAGGFFAVLTCVIAATVWVTTMNLTLGNHDEELANLQDELEAIDSLNNGFREDLNAMFFLNYRQIHAHHDVLAARFRRLEAIHEPTQLQLQEKKELESQITAYVNLLDRMERKYR